MAGRHCLIIGSPATHTARRSSHDSLLFLYLSREDQPHCSYNHRNGLRPTIIECEHFIHIHLFFLLDLMLVRLVHRGAHSALSFTLQKRPHQRSLTGTYSTLKLHTMASHGTPVVVCGRTELIGKAVGVAISPGYEREFL